MDLIAAMEAFVRAVDLGSLSAAARKLGAKPSSVSRRIAALEDELGAQLLRRSTHTLSLTEAGVSYYEHATHILAQIEEVRAAVSGLGGELRGTLRVHAPVGFGRLHVMPALPAFLRRHTGLVVELTLDDGFVDLVEEGVDLAIRIGVLADSSLVAKKLARQTRVACASPGYLQGAPPLATPHDLSGHACLVHTPGHGPALWEFAETPEGQGAVGVAVSGPLRTNNSEATRLAALDGLGIANLPTWLIGEDLRSGRLRSVLDAYQPAALAKQRGIYAVYPPARHLAPKVRAFIGWLEERFGRPPYWDRPALSVPAKRHAAG